ncbi:hypothetical protein BKG96_05110 [Rodentibacter caecimuris]|uniref:Uncharacterized protein n=1 Tax=Rodentibacter caecimuris TaxID=1796644 RepID=A0A1V3KM27_9PAST|nr:hypothetical protein [Rodentibacter heylii]OOF78694.1 hypothetical protein BKG96_05110 [Rodentibacter heylii]
MAESKLKEVEMAKKYGYMKEACMSLRVAKTFFLNAKNEEQYKYVNELLKKKTAGSKKFVPLWWDFLCIKIIYTLICLYLIFKMLVYAK